MATRLFAVRSCGHTLRFFTRRRAQPLTTDALTSGIATKCEELMNEVLMPLNEQTRGPLGQSFKPTPLPFVFLLGNHSSGKSSFINYVQRRRVQQTGIAPTDDGFTIIAPGPEDLDQDGPSLVGDPDFGFGELRRFGPGLIHHVSLKVRADMHVRDVMLIDSPGMIDSPSDSVVFRGGERGHDRGYDFEGVTRWLAERADVILLFFDPDKPGTTGETLSVLTNSLSGMDHKLHIILNKVDNFSKIHDFARAYGSLCWNLSKVITRKDLPRIYTMYTPNSGGEGGDDQRKRSRSEEAWSGVLQELESTRSEVLDEVRRAPARRIDNMVTHVYDSARVLEMHMLLMNEVLHEYTMARRRVWGIAAAVGVGGNAIALSALAGLAGVAWGFSAVVSASSVAGATGLYLYGSRGLEDKVAEMEGEEWLDALFRRIYRTELASNDAFTQSLWYRVRPRLQVAFSAAGIPNLRSSSNRDMQRLRNVVEDDVPQLRRRAAPLASRVGYEEEGGRSDESGSGLGERNVKSKGLKGFW